MKLPKELIKELVREQKFTSTTQIMDTMKEMFSDFQGKSSNVKLKNTWVMKNTSEEMMVQKMIGMAQPNQTKNSIWRSRSQCSTGTKCSYEPQILNKYCKLPHYCL